MKIVCLGDLHIRKHPPEKRIDKDYFSTILKKLTYVLDISEDSGVDLILQPGDFFDHFNTPYPIVSKILYLITKYRIPWYVVYGQHDLIFHSLKEVSGTALNLVSAPDYVSILSDSPIYMEDWNSNSIALYGKSWGEKFPTIEDTNCFNVLVAHHMVTNNGPLWPGQKDYQDVKEIQRNKGFDLMVFGDNHNTFFRSVRNRHVFNCGSLMRSSIDQQNHRPMFAIYDTKNNKPIEKIEIPIAPAREIFDFEAHEQERQKSEKTSALISRLKKTYQGSTNFRRNLQQATKSNRIRKGVKQAISEALPGGKENDF